MLALGPRAAVLTGGHRERAVDLFATAGEPEAAVAIEGERHPDGAAHGSGCTHSAALAAQLALGRDPLAAARAARELAGEAIAGGLRDVGAGAGPVDVLGLPRHARAAEAPAARRGGRGSVCHNPPTMRLLRMTPGHGEIVLVEGDVEVPEEEAELIEAFRASSTPACGRRCRPRRAAGAARPSW